MVPTVGERMRRVRQRDTALELAVRRVLYSMGVRYRVCPPGLPGRPDVANRRRRWALFVHGCFWHGHEGCLLAKLPRTNTEFWRKKIAANRARDARKERELRHMGFNVGVVWQCEMKDAPSLTAKLRGFVDGARDGGTP